ncbi:MAG TPA: SpoIID/LytB domain-containing protein [Longimicrobium sp.]|nr:SpoIID/LytB domain-containing protein [Longimicrobium sp.]
MISSRIRRLVPAAALLLGLGACVDGDPIGLASPEGGPRLDEGVSAQAWNGNIRIGVIPTATSVTIGSAADWTITNKTTGTVLLSGAGGVSATVTLESGSVSETRWRLQVMCSSPAAVAARKAAAEAAGHPTHTEPVPAANCTRLYIGSFPANASFGVRNTYRTSLINAGLAGTDSFWRQVTIVTGVTQYRVKTGTQEAVSSGPVVLTSSDNLVKIGTATYRGIAEVRINSGGTLAGINEVPMEQYLYGVVPRELPPTVYDELEAQKAQAIAARTYAMRGMGKRSSDGYDMLATTTDQVYGGYAAEHPLSTQAVDGTAGLVATYNGQLIEALFFSTSGGATANNEDVYNSAPVPYLRGVIDHQRGNAGNVLDSLKNAHGAQKLRGKRNGDFEGDWSRYHRWSFEWTADEISAVISAYAGQPVGKVLAINVLERGPSGRVLRIEYVTEAGTFTHTRDAIRSSLRYIDANGNRANLLSTLFFVEPVIDKRANQDVLTGFVVYGGGFGHGVGMSQTGAVSMAERGATFEEILKHFYTGIELETRY